MTDKLDVERFVDDVTRANGAGQQAVNEVLARAVSDPARILAGLGEPKQAGLAVLHRGDDITILNVIWAPLMVLLPHDHNMWASIGIYTGREDNITWERTGSTVEAIASPRGFTLSRNSAIRPNASVDSGIDAPKACQTCTM